MIVAIVMAVAVVITIIMTMTMVVSVVVAVVVVITVIMAMTVVIISQRRARADRTTAGRQDRQSGHQGEGSNEAKKEVGTDTQKDTSSQEWAQRYPVSFANATTYQ